MKKLLLTLTAIASLTLLGLTGCDKSSSGSGAAVIDTSAVRAAFASASAVDKAEIEKAMTQIKSGDYPSALTSLKAATANLKLTPEQQQSLKDLLAQIQAKLGTTSETLEKAKAAAEEAAKKAGDAAGKAASDAQKALGK